MMMDHDSITKNQTTERYLLRELTETESDAFEEHYFDCQECAERVRCGTELMEYGREVAREGSFTPITPVPPQPNYWTPALRVGMLAVMLGVGFAVYQKIHVSAPVQQAALESVYVHLEAAKGASSSSATVIGRKQRPVLSFAIPSWAASADAFSYRAVLVLPSGKSLDHQITAHEAEDQIDWQIERDGLTSGLYSVTVRSLGKDGAELKGNVLTFLFTLELKNN
jgi:anti-sigma factor RsiW